MLYYGTITRVFPPGSPENLNKYQYEYSVCVEADLYSVLPLHNVILMDDFGSFDDYSDHVLTIGQKVYVLIAREQYQKAVIIGAIRSARHKMLPAAGRYWSRRFNRVTETIDRSGNWSLKLDQGERVDVHQAHITINNATGEQISINKANKTINVTAGKDWTMRLGGEMRVHADGDVQIQCQSATINAQKDATVNAQGDVTVKSQKNTTINASGKVAVKSSGKTTVDASSIHLNGSGGRVLTTATDPITDPITGLPHQGVSSVKAG